MPRRPFGAGTYHIGPLGPVWCSPDGRRVEIVPLASVVRAPADLRTLTIAASTGRRGSQPMLSVKAEDYLDPWFWRACSEVPPPS